jgi:hypothetical protein
MTGDPRPDDFGRAVTAKWPDDLLALSACETVTLVVACFAAQISAMRHLLSAISAKKLSGIARAFRCSGSLEMANE